MALSPTDLQAYEHLKHILGDTKESEKGKTPKRHHLSHRKLKGSASGGIIPYRSSSLAAK